LRLKLTCSSKEGQFRRRNSAYQSASTLVEGAFLLVI